MGAKPNLTNQEYQDFLIKCAKIGYEKTRKDVLNIVHATLMSKADEEGKQLLKNHVSQGRWVKFCNKWP